MRIIVCILNELNVTLRPAKNGCGTCFGGDHAFFGEVVNLADTLHDICGTKKMRRIHNCPYKRKQKVERGFKAASFIQARRVKACCKVFRPCVRVFASWKLIQWWCRALPRPIRAPSVL